MFPKTGCGNVFPFIEFDWGFILDGDRLGCVGFVTDIIIKSGDLDLVGSIFTSGTDFGTNFIFAGDCDDILLPFVTAGMAILGNGLGFKGD